MKHVGTVIGAAIAGIFVMSVWGAFAGAYGIAGGWFAGLIIIGTMWHLNHYIGIHNNEGAFVDMATGIGVCGLTRGMFEGGFQAGVDSLPTLSIVIVGGICGGLMAVQMEKVNAEREKQADKAA